MHQKRPFNHWLLGMAQEVKPALKNKSEILFEAHLRSQGHTDFAFEPEILQGKLTPRRTGFCR